MCFWISDLTDRKRIQIDYSDLLSIVLELFCFWSRSVINGEIDSVKISVLINKS